MNKWKDHSSFICDPSLLVLYEQFVNKQIKATKVVIITININIMIKVMSIMIVAFAVRQGSSVQLSRGSPNRKYRSASG